MKKIKKWKKEKKLKKNVGMVMQFVKHAADGRQKWVPFWIKSAQCVKKKEIKEKIKKNKQ